MKGKKKKHKKNNKNQPTKQNNNEKTQTKPVRSPNSKWYSNIHMSKAAHVWIIIITI